MKYMEDLWTDTISLGLALKNPDLAQKTGIYHLTNYINLAL